MSISETEKVTLIVVNYNSTQKLKTLLNTIHLINRIISEIIIVDNSPKNSFKKCYATVKTKIINNQVNLGFAKAVNQGIKISKNDIVLLLNPDCKIINETPIRTFNIIRKNKYIGMIGGRVINTKTGLIIPTATSKPNFLTAIFEFTNIKKLFPQNHFSKLFWIENNFKLTIPIQVHSLCGAYIFLRKKPQCFFNENYFLYLEDLDLGYVIEKNNMETWFDPNSFVMHDGGSSSGSQYKIVLKYWYKSREYYFKNHLSKIESSILYIIFTIEEFILKIFHYLRNTPNA